MNDANGTGSVWQRRLLQARGWIFVVGVVVALIVWLVRR